MKFFVKLDIMFESVCGVLLTLLSLISLSIALSHEDVRNVINRRVTQAKLHGANFADFTESVDFF